MRHRLLYVPGARILESAEIASGLLTTEKDVANLPERAAEILMGALVELYWLKIGIQVNDEAGLMALIESKLRAEKSPR